MNLLERFLSFAAKTEETEEALERALMASAIDFGEMIDSGMEPREAWARCGFFDDDALRCIETLTKESRIVARPLIVRPHIEFPAGESEVERTPTITGAFYIVVVGGGVKGVPSPECMNAHLPPRGRRTRKDYERAWKECTQ